MNPPVSSPAVKVVKSVREQVSAEEWQARVDLAACYRLTAMYGMTEMVANHISCRVPGTTDQFLLNPYGIRTIKSRLSVPVIVDAGVGTASDASLTMEQGVDGMLMNTALAEARDPVAMARAMRLAVEAGRLAFLAGRMPRREVAVPSSPERGMVE